MASQAQLVEFFDMMAERARSGEFRFVMIATIGEDNSLRPTIAGMAADREVSAAVAALTEMAMFGDAHPMAEEVRLN